MKTDILQTFIEIEPVNNEDFYKIKETLERMRFTSQTKK